MEKLFWTKQNLFYTIIVIVVLTVCKATATDLKNKAEILELSGKISLNKDRFILLYEKSSVILSLLPASALDSLNFHPKTDDEITVTGTMSKGALLVYQADWNGQNFTFRDSLGTPLWQETSTHVVNARSCISCKLCVLYCPNDAITMQKTGSGVKAVIDQSKCSGCNICITGNSAKFNGCPVRAISR